MSKAEELARLCDRASGHMSKLIRLTGQGDGENWLTDIADELRRLAQMETEYVSLLKAISDAEPVAWLHKWNIGALTANEKWLARDNMRPYADACDTPLYTLNGIKK